MAEVRYLADYPRKTSGNWKNSGSGNVLKIPLPENSTRLSEKVLARNSYEISQERKPQTLQGAYHILIDELVHGGYSTKEKRVIFGVICGLEKFFELKGGKIK